MSTEMISKEYVGKAYTRVMCPNCNTTLSVHVLGNGSCSKCNLPYSWKEVEVVMPGLGVLLKYSPVFSIKSV